MRRVKILPKRLRETKAERRRRRDFERQHPEAAGLSGLLWTERIVKLKRRRRWAKRADERHLRRIPMATGTIGGRSRALPILHFDPAAPGGDQPVSLIQFNGMVLVCHPAMEPHLIMATKHLSIETVKVLYPEKKSLLVPQPEMVFPMHLGQGVLIGRTMYDSLKEHYRQASMPKLFTEVDKPVEEVNHRAWKAPGGIPRGKGKVWP